MFISHPKAVLGDNVTANNNQYFKKEEKMKIKMLQNKPYLSVSWGDKNTVKKISYVDQSRLTAIQTDLDISIYVLDSELMLTITRKIDIESEIENQMKEFNAAVTAFTDWFINLEEVSEEVGNEDEEIKTLLKKILKYVQAHL